MQDPRPQRASQETASGPRAEAARRILSMESRAWFGSSRRELWPMRAPLFIRPADAARTTFLRRERPPGAPDEPVLRMAPGTIQSKLKIWTPTSTRCPPTSSTTGRSTTTNAVPSTIHGRHLVVHPRTLRKRAARQALPWLSAERPRGWARLPGSCSQVLSSRLCGWGEGPERGQAEHKQ